MKNPKRTVLFPHSLRRIASRLFVVLGVSLTIASVATGVNSQQNQVQAATNNTINFQARLLQSNGALVPDGNYNVEFKIYNSSVSSGSAQGTCTGDASCLWRETRTGANKVRVFNGYLTVNLGSVQTLPNINWSQDLYLTMNIGGAGTSATWDGEMNPRLHLTAVPYALTAGSLSVQQGSYGATLTFATLTNNRTITVPDASGTLCLDQSVNNCGYLTAGGASGSYVAKGTTLETGNFALQSAAATSVGGVLQAAAGQTADLLRFNAADGSTLSKFTANGSLVITNDIAVGGAATYNTLAATALTQNGNVVCDNSGNCNAYAGGSGSGNYVQNQFATAQTANFNIQSGSAGTATAVITRVATQTAPLLKMVDENGTDLVIVYPNGSVYTAGAININGSIAGTSLGVTSLQASNVGAIIRGASAQTGDLLQIQNDSGQILSSINASGDLTLGSATRQGKLIFTDGTNNGYTASILVNTLSDNYNYVLPDGGGAICTSTTGCGASAGSGNYIQVSAILQANANFNIQTGSANVVTARIRALNGQTADLQRFESSTGTKLSGFGTDGQLTLGTIATTGTGLQGGYLRFADGTTSGFSAVLQSSQLTANRTINLPDADGTLCLQNSAACGFAATTGGTGYIQNQYATAQQANMYIQGVAGQATATFQSSASDNLLLFKNSGGTTTGFIKDTGAIVIGVNQASGSRLTVNSNAAAAVNIVSVGASNQTGDLYQNQNVNGNVLSGFNANGQFFSYGTGATIGNLAVPAGVASSTTGSSFFYKVTAVNAQGETIGSSEVSGSSAATTVSWAAVPGATSYRVYRGTATGAQTGYASVTAPTVSLSNAQSVVLTAATAPVSTIGTGLTVTSWAGQTGNPFSVVGSNGTAQFFTVNGTGETRLGRNGYADPYSGASASLKIGSTGTAATAQLIVGTSNSATAGIITRAAVSQTADLFQLQNSSAVTLSGFNAAGNLYLQSGTFANTLSTTTLTAARTIALPDESGTICLQGSVNCGFLSTATANAGYIQNQTASAQIANFWIQAATGTVAAKIQGSASNDIIQIMTSGGQNALRVNNTGTTVAERGFVAKGSADSSLYSAAIIAQATNAAYNALVAQGFTGQTANIIQITDVNGNILSGFNNTGAIFANGTANVLSGLTYPTGIFLATAGTAGSTSYSYRISAVNSQGETIASPEVTIATGNATLSATNYILGTFSAVPGATSYKVYGRTAGAQQFLMTIASTGATNYGFADQGTVTPSGALPTGTSLSPVLTISTPSGNASSLVVKSASGSNYFGINSSGNVDAYNGARITGNYGQVASLLVVSTGTLVGQVLQGTSSQTADLLQNRDSNNVVLSGTTAAGALYTNGAGITINALQVPAFTTASTGSAAYYVITATNAAGETVASTALGMANSSSTITWSQVAGATGYKIYRNTSNSFTAGSLLRTTITNGTTTSFTDNAAATTAGLPPTVPTATGTGLTIQGWRGQTGNLLTITGITGTNAFTVNGNGNANVANGIVVAGTTASGYGTNARGTIVAKMSAATGTTDKGLIVQATTGNAADLVQLQDANANALSGFNNAGNLYFQSGAFTGTLLQGTLTANRTYTLPDIDGTLCTTTTCASGGAGAYIQNGTTLQTANFNIQGATTTDPVAVIRGAIGATAEVFQVYTNGTTKSLAVTAGGNIYGVGSLGLNDSSFTAKIGIATAQVGIRVNETGTANIAEFQNTGVNVVTIGATGATTIKNSTNSTSALATQNTNGDNLFRVDTQNNQVALLENNSPETSAWTSTAVTNLSASGAVAYNGYLYMVGGTNSVLTRYAKINADGSTGTWNANTSLPAPRDLAGVGVSNGFLYVIGGRDGAGTSTNSSYYSKINADGTLGTWNTTTNLPGNMNNYGFTSYNGYLYASGGNGTTLSYYAKVNADGTLGAWNNATALPASRNSHSMTAVNGYMLLLGGTSLNGYTAKINADGSLGTWTAITNLPALRNNAPAVLANGYIYLLGGFDGTSTLSSVIYAKVNSDGTIGAWTTSGNALPGAKRYGGAAFYGGTLYFPSGATNYQASLARVKVSGTLDLVGNAGGDAISNNGAGELLAGNTGIMGSLMVQGDTALRNTVISGVLNVSGATVLGSTLTVNGATVIQSTLSASGALQTGTTTTAGSVVVTAGNNFAATIQSATLTANRSFTLPDVSGTLCTTTTCAAGGSANYIQNGTTQQAAANFNIDGNGVLGGSLNVSGASTLASLSVTGNASVGGNLAVTGTTTFTGAVTANGSVILNGATAVTNVLSAQVTGDTNPRFTIGADGKLSFGTGSAATDVTLYRSSANTLATDVSLTVGSRLGIGSSNSSAKFFIGIPTPTVIGQLTKGVAGQTADFFQLQNSSSTVLSGFNAAGNLYFQSGTFANTLSTTTLTAARTISLPDADGTICLQGATACGFAATTGGTGYIQNQSAAAQTANFWIQSTSAGAIVAKIQAASGQTADIFVVQNSAGTVNALRIDSSNNVNIAKQLSIGNNGLGYSTGDMFNIIATGTTVAQRIWSSGTGDSLQFGTASVGPSAVVSTKFDANGNLSSSGTTTTLAGLQTPTLSTSTPGTAAYFKVAAVNAQGETAASNEIGIAAGGSLSWTQSAGATGYRLYRGTAAGGENTVGVLTAPAGGLSNADTAGGFVAGTPLSASSVTSPVLRVTGWTSNTNSNIFEALTSSGTGIRLNGAGNVNLNGGAYLNGSVSCNSTAVALCLTSANGSIVSQMITAGANQAVDLFRIIDSNANTIAKFDKDGNLSLQPTFAPAAVAAANGTAATNVLAVAGGAGGAVTGTGFTGGTGAGISLTGGQGGNAISGSTNGNGGAITLQGGAAGAGAGTAGVYGDINLQQTGGRVIIGSAAVNSTRFIFNSYGGTEFAGYYANEGNPRFAVGRDLISSGNAGIGFATGTGSGLKNFVGSNAANGLGLYTNGKNERLTISSTGLVGIANTNPQTALDVTGVINASGALQSGTSTVAGALVLQDGAGFTATIQTASALAGNVVFRLPGALAAGNYDICTSSNNCNFASGGGSYINNAYAVQQTGNINIISATGTAVGLKVQSATSGTANIAEFYNSAGNLGAYIDAGGNIRTGSTVASIISGKDLATGNGGSLFVGTQTSFSANGGRLNVTTASATTVGAAIRGVASQTADLVQYQDANGVVQSGTSANGNQYGNGTNLTLNNLAVPAAPTVGSTGTAFYYAVAAVNGNGTTLPSAGTGASTNSTTVTWTQVTGATGYKVYRSTTNNFAVGQTVTLVSTITNGTTVSFADTAAAGTSTTIIAPAGTGITLQTWAGQSNDVLSILGSGGSQAVAIKANGNIVSNTVDSSFAGLTVGAGYTTHTTNKLLVGTTTATTIGQVIRGVNAQAADLIQYQDTSNNVLSGINAAGRFYNQSGFFTGTLAQATLTANRTYTLPDESGTICLQNSTNCGFLTGTANSYIQNGTSPQTGSNFNIDGNGVIGGTLTVTGATTLGTLTATNGSFSGTLAVTGASTFTGSLTANGGVTLNGATAATNVLNAQVAGDTNARFTIGADGKLSFGTGAAAADATISRGGTNQLRASGTFYAPTLSAGSNAGFGTALGVVSNNATQVSIGARAYTGQTADFIQLQTNATGNAVLAGFNVAGNLYYGNNGFTTTLNTATLSANQTITLPNESGTICLQASANCGFLTTTTANGNYIQNQSATAQTANLYIQSSNAASVTAVLQAAAGQTANIFNVTNSVGNNLLTVSASGRLQVQAFNSVGTLASSFNGQLTVNSGAAANVSLISKGVASQTGDLFQLQDSAATVLAKFDATGNLTTPSITTSGNATIGGNQTVAGTSTVTGNATFSANLMGTSTSATNYLLGTLGLGTANPQAGDAMTIANGKWISAVDAAGTGFVNILSVNANNEIQLGAALNVDGGIMLPTDGGQVAIADMNFTSGQAAGTANSYTFGIGNSNALTVYGENTGAGAAQNVRVAIGSSIAPAYTLDVAGDINTTGTIRVNGVSINTAGTLTNVAYLNQANTFTANQTAPVFNAGTGFRVNGAATAGQFLRGDGTNFVSSSIQASDVPDLSTSYVRNQTTQQASSNFNISGAGVIGTTLNVSGATTLAGLSATNGSFSGTLAVTGASTFTGALTANGGVILNGATAATNVLTSQVTGDTNARFTVGADGKFSFGSGAAASDTTLYRLSPGVLRTDAGLYIGGNNQIGGVVTIGQNTQASTKLTIQTSAANQIGAGIRAASGQTADLTQFLAADGTSILSSFSATGQLTLGRVATTGTVQGGSLTFSDGTTSGFGATITSSTLTANRAFTLPNVGGEICTSANNCGYGTATGSFINNGVALQSSANFNIDGTGKAATINATGALQLNGTSINTAGTLTNVAYLNQANTFTGNLTVSGSNSFTTGTGTVTIGSLGAGVVQSSSTGVLSSGTLTVANGGTGFTSATTNGIVFGNGTGTLGVTAAGTNGQLLVANASGVPTFVSLSGDVTVSATGVTTIANNAITTAKIADAAVTNAKLANSSVTITPGTNLTTGGTVALGGTVTLNVANSPSFSGSVNAATGFQFNGTAAAGQFLRGNGTNFVSSAIQASDIPDLSTAYIKNSTTQQTASNFNISGAGVIGTTLNVSGATTITTLSATNGSFSGTLGVTGLATFAGGITSSTTTGTGVVFQTQLNAEANARFTVNGNGLLGFGNGTGATDTFLFRPASTAGLLSVSNSLGVNTTTKFAQLGIQANNSTVGFAVRTGATQTADLFQLQNNDGSSVIAKFDASGNLTVPSVTATGAVQGATVNATTGFQLNGAATSGNFLRGNGTNFVSSALTAGDITAGSTNYIQNTTTQQASSNFNISGAGVIGTTLNVAGASTLASLSATTGSFSSTLNVTGATTLAGLSASSGTFTGNTSFSGSSNSFSTQLGVGVASSSSAALRVQSPSGSGNAIGILTRAGNTSAAFRVATQNNDQLAAINTDGTLVLGNSGASFQQTGSLRLQDGVASGFYAQINSAALTANRTFTLPDVGGTICTTANNCNYASNTGSYINNGTTQQTAANFNIDGNGVIGGTLNVSGATTITTLSATNGTFSGTLAVTGASTFSDTATFSRATGNAAVFGNGTAGQIALGDQTVSRAAGTVLFGANVTTTSGSFIGSGLNATLGGVQVSGTGTLSQSLRFGTAGSDTASLSVATTGGYSSSAVVGDVVLRNLGTNGNIILQQGTGAAQLYVQGASGNVGIGNANPGSKLDVTGTFNASGAATLGSTLAVTGNASAPVFNAGTGFQIAGAATSGNFLRGNGTNFVSSALQAGDIVAGSTNYIQNGTSQQASSNFNISGAGVIGTTLNVSGATTITTLSATNGTFSGTLGVTGASTFTGAITANGGATFNGAANGSTNIVKIVGGSNQTGTSVGIQNGVGQTGALLSFNADANAGGYQLSGFNTSGQLYQYSGSFIGTIAQGALTANQTYTLPSTGGTLCTTTTCALAGGSYINNGTTQQASANFNISGAGVIGTTLNVSGATTLAALSATNGTFSGTLGVTGASTLTGKVSVGTGALTAAALTVRSTGTDDIFVLQRSGGGSAFTVDQFANTTLYGNQVVNNALTVGYGFQVSGTQVAVLNASATTVGLQIQAAASQTADLQQFRNNGGTPISGFNANGQLYQANSGFTTTLNTATLTANRTITLPNASGTICLDSNNCNFAMTGQYIVNGTSQQATSNFNISGAGVIGTNLTVNGQTTLGRTNITTPAGNDSDGGLNVYGANTFSTAFLTRLSSDAQFRYTIDADGAQNWGPGNGSIGATIAYVGNSTLSLTGNLSVSGLTTLKDTFVQGASRHYSFNDATTTNGSWMRIGTLNLSQFGNNATIKIYAGAGYQGGNDQEGRAEINIRTSNGGAGPTGFGAGATYSTYGAAPAITGVKLVSNAAGAGASTYTVYVQTGIYIGNGYYTVDTSDNGSWTNNIASATDPGANSSTVYAAIKYAAINDTLKVINGRVGINSDVISSSATLEVTTPSAATTGLVVFGNGSQANDLAQFWRGSTLKSGVNAQGTFYYQSGSYQGVLQQSTLTANRSYTLPDASGTICLDSSVNNCAYAANAGSNNYIQNTNTQQTANFNVSGNGTLGGILSAATVSGTAINGGSVTATGTVQGATLNTTGTLTQGGTTILTSGRALQNLTGITTSGGVLFNQAAADQFRLIATGAPTTDMFNISNSGQPTVTNGVNGQQVDYFANLSGTSEASAQRLNITSTSTAAGSVTNGLRVVVSSSTAGGLNGIKIDATTATAATRNAINIGSGWNNVLSVNGQSILGGTGVLNPFAISGQYTGLTGTGTLVSGSIGSGFGTIATGNGIQGSTLNATTGFQLNGAATTGTYLRGNGTNYVSSAIQASDLPDLGTTYIKNGTTQQTGNFSIRSAAAGSITARIQGASGQTADLLRITDGNGGDQVFVSGSGYFSAYNGSYFKGATQFETADPNAIPVNIKGASGQVVDLLQITNNANTIVARVNAAGALTATGATFNLAAGGQVLTAATAVPTTDQVRITNAGFPATADGINGQQVDFFSNVGTSGQQTSAQRLNVTNTSGTVGANTNGLRVVATANVASNTTGIRIDGITSASGNIDSAFFIGSGWDNILNYNGNVLINGAGLLQNFAVSGAYTGLTGTGALASGSIAAGFGTISTNSDISTTTNIQGSLLNATTGFRINGGATTGQFLRGNGTNFVSSAILAADLPAGSSNYIQNGVALQQGNFNIQSTAATNVGGVIQRATNQSADLLQFKSSDGATILARFNQNAQLTVPSLTTNDFLEVGTTFNTHGNVTLGAFDFKLGSDDQTTRGNSGLSRAMVKDGGNVLTINYAGDYTGGTKINSNLNVTGTSTVAALTGTTLTASSTLTVQGTGTSTVAGPLAVGSTTLNANAFTVSNGSSVFLQADSQNTRTLFGTTNTPTLSSAKLVATVAEVQTTLRVGDASNGVSYNDGATGASGKLRLYGSARNAKKVILTAEYAGAVLDPGTSTNTSGTLTAGTNSSRRENYYDWTNLSSTAASYDIVVSTPVPSDWSAWSGTSVVCLNNFVTNASASVKLTVLGTSGGAETNASAATASTSGAWNTYCFTPTASYVADGLMTVRITMTAANGAEANVGNLTFSYLSAY